MRGRSFKDFFSRDRKALYMILGILLVSISSLTIVYAALSVTLNIIGTADISAASWDVHLENVKVTSGSVSGDAPTITGGTTATFSTSLTTPGDFYEFTIDVVNDGSIDAMIDGITKTPTLTETQGKYLNYIIEYQNGESINTKQLVSSNSYVRLKVRVEYRKDITAPDLPTKSETLNLSFTVNYVQSDGTEESVRNNGIPLITVISGDYDTIGSELCISNECFYVVSSNEDSITMLAKMNITFDDAPKQTSVRNVTVFSNDEQKGTNYNEYNGSIVEEYVKSYGTYLISLGVIPLESRLITYDELYDLGCNDTTQYTCSNAPSWVYKFHFYWATGPLTEEETGTWVWSVSPLPTGYGSVGLIEYDSEACVRPVITISKSLL